MTSFAGDIQIVCLGALTLLVLYTLWLSRYRGLDGHLTVRWLLLEGAAWLTIIFWRWLPFFSVTSSLQDRELLLMVTVLLFAFVIFLMLDLLVRSSRQSAQIKRLTQELAIQRARIDAIAPEQMLPDGPAPVAAVEARRTARTMSKVQILACIWIMLCIGFSIFDTFEYGRPAYPSSFMRILSATYLQ
jgi:hypothetical protein